MAERTDPEPAFSVARLHGAEAAALIVAALVLAGLTVLSAVREQGEAAASFSHGEAAPARIEVNRASLAELSALPGLGPRKAQRVIEAREKAPIRDLAGLARAAGGLPRAQQERMAPFVEFAP
jgi:DNA uptake protein ComE-like DNA-binding protein